MAALLSLMLAFTFPCASESEMFPINVLPTNPPTYAYPLTFPYASELKTDELLKSPTNPPTNVPAELFISRVATFPVANELLINPSY